MQKKLTIRSSLQRSSIVRQLGSSLLLSHAHAQHFLLTLFLHFLLMYMNPNAAIRLRRKQRSTESIAIVCSPGKTAKNNTGAIYCSWKKTFIYSLQTYRMYFRSHLFDRAKKISNSHAFFRMNLFHYIQLTKNLHLQNFCLINLRKIKIAYDKE